MVEGNQFDHLAKVLAGGASRRGVLRGAAVGLAAAIGLRAIRVEAGQEKAALCHYTGSASNPWELITVAEPAWNTHFAHGDGFYNSDAHCGACGNACAAPGTCGGAGVEGECGCPATTTVTLDATNPNPVDTGVFLAAGQSVTISASGTAGWFAGDTTTDADGDGACGSYNIPFSCGSFVGVVGGGDIFVDYRPFTQLGVGPNVLTASTGGNIVLQYVDGCPGSECYGDNSGSLTVTIDAPAC